MIIFETIVGGIIFIGICDLFFSNFMRIKDQDKVIDRLNFSLGKLYTKVNELESENHKNNITIGAIINNIRNQKKEPKVVEKTTDERAG